MIRQAEKHKRAINEAILRGPIVFAATCGTSYSPNAKIWDLSLIKTRFAGCRAERMFETIDSMHLRIHPGAKLSEAVKRDYGITDDDLTGLPSIDDSREMVEAFMKDAGSLVTYGDIPRLQLQAGYPGCVLAEHIDLYQMGLDIMWRTLLLDHSLHTIAFSYRIIVDDHPSAEDATSILPELMAGNIREMQRADRNKDALYAPYVRSVGKRSLFRGQTRLYINLDIGTIYYEVLKDVFRAKDAVDMDKISLTAVCNQVIKLYRDGGIRLDDRHAKDDYKRIIEKMSGEEII